MWIISIQPWHNFARWCNAPESLVKKNKETILINRKGHKPLFDNQWLNIKETFLRREKNHLCLYELLLFIQREEMAIEFLTRLGWLSNLQGPGMWAWLPGRFSQERLKPVASGINKTTRMWAWAGASISYHIALHSSSPPSGGSYKNDVTPLQQTPFSHFPPISCGCNMLMWSPVSVILLLQALAASAAFQQCDLKLYPSKFMKYLVCLNVDLWTFTFYLSAMQLASPFPSLEVEETRSALCHGKVSSRASGQNSSLSTWFPCFVAHPGWPWKSCRVSQGPLTFCTAWVSLAALAAAAALAPLQVMVPGRKGDRRFSSRAVWSL